MTFERITEPNRALVNEFVERHWFTITMIVRGKEIDMTKADGFFLAEDGNILGLVTYALYDDVLEIFSLDSLQKNRGIGCWRLLFRRLGNRVAQRSYSSQRMIMWTRCGSIKGGALIWRGFFATSWSVPGN